MTPDYQIIINGTDITANLKQLRRLVSITLNDKSHQQADTVNLTLSNHDNAVDIPDTGDQIRVAIGFSGESLVDKGLFYIDNVRYAGVPNLLTISATSANFRDSWREMREQSWHRQSLGEIVQSIAARHDFQALIADDLRAIDIPHIDQTNEGDCHFINRLAAKFGATALWKNQSVIINHYGARTTASNTTLPTFDVSLSECSGFDFADSNRHSRYTGVKAQYADKKKGAKMKVLAGGEGYTQTLRATYPNRGEAVQAAQARWREMQQQEKMFSCNLAVGRAALIPQALVRLAGFHPHIQAIEWQIASVNHKIDRSGYTSAIECQRTPRGELAIMDLV